MDTATHKLLVVGWGVVRLLGRKMSTATHSLLVCQDENEWDYLAGKQLTS